MDVEFGMDTNWKFLDLSALALRSDGGDDGGDAHDGESAPAKSREQLARAGKGKRTGSFS